MGGGGDTFHNDQYGKAPPKKETFFRLQVYKMVENALVEVYEKVRQICHLSILKGL